MEFSNAKSFLLLFLLFLGSRLIAQSFSTQEGFQEYFIENISKLNAIEGFWKVKPTKYIHKMSIPDQEYIVAIIKKNINNYYESTYKAYKIENGFYSPGNYDITIQNYVGNNYSIKLVKYTSNYTLNGSFELPNGNSYFSFRINVTRMIRQEFPGLFDDVNAEVQWSYIKIFPTQNDITRYSQQAQQIKPKVIDMSTGTCFAISSNGLIATNYHVINEAKTLKIIGVNGIFSKKYSAKIVASDKNNDLALLKIDDYSFSTLGNIPYVVKSKTIDVGSEVIVLGYPLTASMGEEIKLTSGIISAKSGFQGDITSYQTTAPVQPGNSGAPLFDKNGNLIGIINAKHTNAENAGYAIKSSYLLNLIESLPQYEYFGQSEPPVSG